MSSRNRKIPLWHPTLWPSWFGIGILKILCQLPWEFQTRIGAALGWWFYHFVGARRRVVAINLKLCFPEKSDRERKAMAVAHYQANGIGLFETGMAWWAPRGSLPPYEIVGRENLERAAAKGKGVLLLTAHFTTLEICGRIFSDEITMGGLYREPDDPVIARQMRLGRIDKLVPAIRLDDLRGLIRALKEGHSIWYAPDQGQRKFSALVPFFGVPALTTTATSRIASMTGAAVVPFFGTRRPDGVYELNILPALENFPGNDPVADTRRTTALLEEQILKTPEQYFWIHRRFKRRGDDLPNAYL